MYMLINFSLRIKQNECTKKLKELISKKTNIIIQTFLTEKIIFHFPAKFEVDILIDR